MGQEPSELHGPLFVVLFLPDLFWAGELLITTHLVYGRAEVLRRKSGETDRGEAFGLRFCAEQETDGRVGADFTHGTPEGKEFLRVEERARLINQTLGTPSRTQDCRATQHRSCE